MPKATVQTESGPKTLSFKEGTTPDQIAAAIDELSASGHLKLVLPSPQAPKEDLTTSLTAKDRLGTLQLFQGEAQPAAAMGEQMTGLPREGIQTLGETLVGSTPAEIGANLGAMALTAGTGGVGSAAWAAARGATLREGAASLFPRIAPAAAKLGLATGAAMAGGAGGSIIGDVLAGQRPDVEGAAYRGAQQGAFEFAPQALSGMARTAMEIPKAYVKAHFVRELQDGATAELNTKLREFGVNLAPGVLVTTPLARSLQKEVASAWRTKGARAAEQLAARMRMEFSEASEKAARMADTPGSIELARQGGEVGGAINRAVSAQARENYDAVGQMLDQHVSGYRVNFDKLSSTVEKFMAKDAHLRREGSSLFRLSPEATDLANYFAKVDDDAYRMAGTYFDTVSKGETIKQFREQAVAEVQTIRDQISSLMRGAEYARTAQHVADVKAMWSRQDIAKVTDRMKKELGTLYELLPAGITAPLKSRSDALFEQVAKSESMETARRELIEQAQKLTHEIYGAVDSEVARRTAAMEQMSRAPGPFTARDAMRIFAAVTDAGHNAANRDTQVLAKQLSGELHNLIEGEIMKAPSGAAVMNQWKAAREFGTNRAAALRGVADDLLKRDPVKTLSLLNNKRPADAQILRDAIDMLPTGEYPKETKAAIWNDLRQRWAIDNVIDPGDLGEAGKLERLSDRYNAVGKGFRDIVFNDPAGKEYWKNLGYIAEGSARAKNYLQQLPGNRSKAEIPIREISRSLFWGLMGKMAYSVSRVGAISGESLMDSLFYSALTNGEVAKGIGRAIEWGPKNPNVANGIITKTAKLAWEEMKKSGILHVAVQGGRATAAVSGARDLRQPAVPEEPRYLQPEGQDAPIYRH